jgi:hypothetical protein
MVHPFTVHIDPGTQDALPLKPGSLSNTHRRNIPRIREQTDSLNAELLEPPPCNEHERVRGETLPSPTWKQPIADRRAAIRTESEPEGPNTLSRVEDRELCSLAVPPPRNSALDDLLRGDAAVVEPTADLRIVERRLYPRGIRHREWTQRDNSICKRWIRRAQPHRRVLPHGAQGSLRNTGPCDQPWPRSAPDFKSGRQPLRVSTSRPGKMPVGR